MNETLLQIREQEIDKAISASERLTDILQNYSSKEQLPEVAREYFGLVNLLYTAMTRVGMCDYLDNV